VPTTNPNDPLNWPAWRKHVNFALVSLYVLLTFVQLDIGFTAWEQYQEELGFSIDLLNAGAAINYGGLAIGCIFFVPLVHKYGRRPLYLFSTVLQLVSCVWFAVTQTKGDFVGSNLLSGLGGAISETIVQITIADLFFVHHHALMNGWYLFSTFTGAYLGPVASGYIVESQGWRWMWWWCVILFSINLVLIIFLFEESKFVNNISTHDDVEPVQSQSTTGDVKGFEADAASHAEWNRSAVQIDHSIPTSTYRQRMAWFTNSKTDIMHDFYQPVVLLFTFPAIAYTAITYGSLLAWFAILTSVQATYMFSPPYNFTAAGVGLMNVAPFIGSIPGIFLGGWLNDKSILWLARRNGGIYEPEMRLWLALPMSVITPAGILMCGVGLAYVSFVRVTHSRPSTLAPDSFSNKSSQGSPWPLVAVGYGIFGFGLVVAGDIALSYAMDCYHDVCLFLLSSARETPCWQSKHSSG
jgi:MFS family permease